MQTPQRGHKCNRIAEHYTQTFRQGPYTAAVLNHFRLEDRSQIILSLGRRPPLKMAKIGLFVCFYIQNKNVAFSHRCLWTTGGPRTIGWELLLHSIQWLPRKRLNQCFSRYRPTALTNWQPCNRWNIEHPANQIFKKTSTQNTNKTTRKGAILGCMRNFPYLFSPTPPLGQVHQVYSIFECLYTVREERFQSSFSGGPVVAFSSKWQARELLRKMSGEPETHQPLAKQNLKWCIVNAQ